MTVGLFIEFPTPFLKEFFEHFSKLNYTKSKITLLIHRIDYHAKDLDAFIAESNDKYKSVSLIQEVHESVARANAL